MDKNRSTLQKLLDELNVDEESASANRSSSPTGQEYGPKSDNNPPQFSFPEFSSAVMSSQDTEMKLKSINFATLGNQKMKTKEYNAASKFYTLAIQKFDKDSKYFADRSTCFTELGQFDKALEDANHAIEINSGDVHGHVAKGSALTGLSKFDDAETAFKAAQLLNSEIDITIKLRQVREGYLRELGFDEVIVKNYSRKFGTIDEAVSAASEEAAKKILAGGDLESNMTNLNLDDCHSQGEQGAQSSRTESHRSERPQSQWSATASRPVRDKSSSRPSEPGSYVKRRSISKSRVSSRMSDTESVSSFQRNGTCEQFRSATAKHPAYAFQDIQECDRIKPKNIYGFTGLWVGNVYPKVARGKVIDLFSKYGEVKDVQIKEKNNNGTAFVSFDDTESPRMAIRDIYGRVIPGISNGNAKLRIRFAAGHRQDDRLMRNFGKLKDEECYYWRTTGCSSPNCPKIHEPICRGIDFQPWML